MSLRLLVNLASLLEDGERDTSDHVDDSKSGKVSVIGRERNLCQTA